MVKRLLIVGSGFSKAVSSSMPTVTELAEHLREEEALQQDPYDKLVDDPELLLSYLSLEQPWKKPPEALEDKALFVRVQQALADFIADCEAQAFKNPIPEWSKEFIEYLLDSRAPVIIFNYDTVLERILYMSRLGREIDLYDLPLTLLWSRVRDPGGYLPARKFHLIKLHGSINWFYSGVEGFPGEQVYYHPVDSNSPRKDGTNIPAPEFRQLTKDKIPLIIPPVAEKSRFYSNQTLRSLWWDARKALAEADEIFCVGYSLPPTDLTTKLLFRSVAHPRRVFIVNRSASDLDLKKRYREAFPETEVNDDFDGEDAVKKMVDYLALES